LEWFRLSLAVILTPNLLLLSAGWSGAARISPRYFFKSFQGLCERPGKIPYFFTNDHSNLKPIKLLKGLKMAKYEEIKKMKIN